ncbi:MAG TPA: plastocyanin/azurin family copper-binding protein [Xanthomonadales bacterium]|nr:plastocyanin/azurin family copper-binding protein [Xanthomonadales bacterium]
MSPILLTAFRLAIIFLVTMPLTGLAQTTHTVTVGDNFFSPSQLTIQVGDTVRWVNAAGGMAHNVTSNTGAWAASPTASSFTFEVTFNQAGMFGYTCTLHANMSGTITVQSTTPAEPEVELVSVAVLNSQTFAPGDPITVEASIRNNGNAASGAFSITYYASTDTAITAGDIALGTFQVADLAGGQTRSQQNMPALPGNIVSGQYFIGGILSFSDSNNNNHTAMHGSSVTVAAASTFLINAGLNDVWATPGKARQGILIAVLPVAGVFFSAWFTFDSEPPPPSNTAELGFPDQRWLTMEGSWQDNKASLQVYSTTGGVFDSANPVPDASVAIGTMTIEFHDCNNATATYNIPGLGLENTVPLVRVVPDNATLCEELNLALQP